MVTSETLTFMRSLGTIVTDVNVLLLASFAVMLLIAGTQMTFGSASTTDDDAGPSTKMLGISFIPLALIMGYAAWVIMGMVSRNSDLATLVGFVAFLRALFF